jgi:hypothetical protein
MTVIAHAGHYALGLLEATPVLIVAVAALWKTRAARRQLVADAGHHDGAAAPGPHA